MKNGKKPPVGGAFYGLNKRFGLLGVISVFLLGLALTFSLSLPGFATSTSDSTAPEVTVGPGATNVLVMDFVIQDGGDVLITGTTLAAGTPVIHFTDDTKMYVDQGDSADNYEDGEDILSVSVTHNGTTSGSLDGQTIMNFDSGTRYANDSHGGGYTDGEALILTNDSSLDPADTVITSGVADLTDFDGNTRYTDADDSGTPYTDGEAIVVTSDNTLHPSDTIITSGAAALTAFATSDYVMEDTATNNGNYDDGEAIFSSTDTELGSADELLKAGKVDLKNFDSADGVYVNDENSTNNNWDSGEDIVYDDNGTTDSTNTVILYDSGTQDADGSTDQLEAADGASPYNDLAYIDADHDGTYDYAAIGDGEPIVNLGDGSSISDGADFVSSYSILAIPGGGTGSVAGQITGLSEDWIQMSTLSIRYAEDATNDYDGPEAIVDASTNSATLESGEVITPGTARITGFDSDDAAPDTVFADADGSSSEPEYDYGEAIVRDAGTLGRLDELDTLGAGSETVITSGSADLTQFAADSEMFLNQATQAPEGNAGYGDGDDILSVSLTHNGDTSTTISGNPIQNFANNIKHEDPADSNVYDNGEAIIKDNDMNSIYRDVFNAITLQNAGSAVDTQDIPAVEVWADEGSAGFQGTGTDMDLGTATWDNDSWDLSNLTRNVDSSGQRIYVTVDVTSNVASDKTVKMEVPTLSGGGDGAYDAGDEGLFLASTDDTGGITNSFTQYLDVRTATVQVTVSPKNVVADGESAATLQARVLGSAGQPLEGVTVDFSTQAGSLSSSTATTGSTGKASVTLTAPTKQAVSTVTATASGSSDSATVFFKKQGAPDVANSTTQRTGPGEDSVDAKGIADTAVTKSGTGTPAVSVAQYESNPGRELVGSWKGSFIDVHINSSQGVDSLRICKFYPTDVDESTVQLLWWDGEEWRPVSSQSHYPEDTDGYGGKVCATITGSSTPSLDQMGGTVFSGTSGELVSTTLQGTWNMISVPASPVSSDPEAQLEDDIDWPYVYGWDPAAGEYKSPPELQLEEGGAYWVRTEGGGTVDLTVTPTDRGSQTVDLPRAGWHQIGLVDSSAINRSLNWQEIKVIKDAEEMNLMEATEEGYLDGENLFSWNSSKAIYMAGPDKTINPWEGFWVKTYVDNLKLKMYFAPEPPSSSAKVEDYLKGLSSDTEAGESPPPPPFGFKPSEATPLEAVATPNPATSSEGIAFKVFNPEVEALKAVVYAPTGQVVHKSSFKEGRQVSWDLTSKEGRPVANGLYLYVLKAKLAGKVVRSKVKTLLVLQ